MANTTTRKNHYEIISRLEKELNDLKGLSDAYVRLMGKDDPSLQVRIEKTKSHYSLLKKYQDKYLELISFSDIQLRIANSNERIKIKDDDELSTVTDEKIKDKIKNRTWSENEYWGTIFITNFEPKVTSKKEEAKKAAAAAPVMNYLSNQEAAEAYFSAAIYEHDYSSAKEGQYLKKKKNIAKASFNLHEFYEQNGSLSNVPADGIDTQCRRVLELVFKNGLDRAKEILNNERQEKLESEREEPVRPSGSSKSKSQDNDIIEINLTEFELLEVLNEYDLFALNLNTNIKVTIISIDDINLEAVGINYKAKNESKTYKIVVKEY